MPPWPPPSSTTASTPSPRPRSTCGITGSRCGCERRKPRRPPALRGAGCPGPAPDRRTGGAHPGLQPRTGHRRRPGRTDERCADGRPHEPRGLRGHPGDQARDLLEPEPGASLGEGRDERQHHARRPGAPGLRWRHRADNGRARRPGLPHGRPILLRRTAPGRQPARRLGRESRLMIHGVERTGGVLPLGAYGLIGDCRSAALVGLDGSIDWCCLPRFDSPSLFGRLLDARNGGHWQLRPRGAYRAEQRYEDRTNILRTIFSTPTGRVQVSDFMPVDEETIAHHARPHPSPRIVRIVDCLTGSVSIEHSIAPRPDYGRSPAGFQAEGRRFHGDAGALHFCVVSTAEIRGASGGFTLRAGDAVALSLRCPHARGDSSTSEKAWTVQRALGLLRETQAYWWRWIGKVRYAGAYPEAVWRSALALKLMIYAPTGAIVAAPT